MRRIGPGVLLLVVLPALADDPAKGKDTAKPPADRLAAIKKEVADAQTAYFKAAREAAKAADKEKAGKDQQAAYEQYEKAQKAGFQAAFEIAKADPTSDAGFAALSWLMSVPRSFFLDTGPPMLELALKHHTKHPKAAELVDGVQFVYLYGGPDPKREPLAAKFLDAVAADHPDRAARGKASLIKAMKAVGTFARAEHQKAADADKLAAAADAALEAVKKEYADVPTRRGTVGKQCEKELFALRNLRIGKVAPDIEGEDLDGVRFKLSDYRGKVVVIDFWGDW